MKKLDVPQVGSQGDEVASRNRYGPHWRKKGRPKRKPTPDRRQADWAMREVAAAWNEVTDEQWQLWAIAAASESSKKVLGKSSTLDPRACFSKVNIPRARLGMELLMEPPPRKAFGPNPVQAFAIVHRREGIALKLLLDRVPDAEILVRAAPPANPGRRRHWDYRVLDVLRNPVAGLNDFTELFVRKYGVPRVGRRVFIQTWQQRDGWRGTPWQASVVVPPRPSRPAKEMDRRTQGTK